MIILIEDRSEKLGTFGSLGSIQLDNQTGRGPTLAMVEDIDVL